MMYSAYRAATSAVEWLPGPWQPAPRPQGAADGVIHGASAGEVKAALALLEPLQKRRPEQRWVVSSGTAAGITAGAQFRLPRDLPARTCQLFDSLQLRSLLLVEAELWPNLLAEAARRDVPVAVVSARVSEPSAARMRRLGAAAQRLLQGISVFIAASPGDADRLLALGVPQQRIEVGGWLKWPATHDPNLAPSTTVVDLAFARARPLLVLGSVHPGEASLLARRLAGSPLAPGRSNWLLVARHEGSAARLAREARQLCPEGSFFVDSRMGVLRSWYSHADAAFVGGGGRGRGCHDLLEPVAAGLRPLCFLRRGDPGGVGEVLGRLGLALCLDEQRRATEIAALATERVPGAWAQLRRDHDGRERSLDVLEARGLLTA
jgi:3-deoxy-D-manno-octulosonic-acid transferase